MELLPLTSGSEYSGGLRLSVTPERVVACCIDSALGLGFVLKEQDGLSLRFREPLRWTSWPVEMAVEIAPHPDYTGVSVLGSCYGGKPGQPLEYLKRCVDIYLSMVGAALNEARLAAAADPGGPVARRPQRTGQYWLGKAAWLPQLLLVPMVVAAVLLWPRPGALVLVSWACLMVLVPPVAEFFRRRLVGTRTSGDGVVVAVGVGMAIVFTIFYMFFVDVF
jgi:hypothetical protein